MIPDLLQIVPDDSIEVQPKLETETETETTMRYLRDTSNSLNSMFHRVTGLPTDRIEFQPDGTRWIYNRTSQTNIGLGIACTAAQRDLDFINETTALDRMEKMLLTLGNMKRNGAQVNGLRTNWVTLDGRPYTPFGYTASSVDTGWLYTGLEVGKYAFPQLAEEFQRQIDVLDWWPFFDEQTGLLYGEVDLTTEQPRSWVYGAEYTEARHAAYVAILRGLPECVYRNMRKSGNSDVTYNGTVFEALMPTLFDNEPSTRHINYVKKVIQHGQMYNNGEWGFSSCDTLDGYKECGLRALAQNPDVIDSTVIAPYALFEAIPFAREESLAGLKKLEDKYPNIYVPGHGFYDSLDRGQVIPHQLCLDQSPALLAPYNLLTNNRMHAYTPDTNRVVRWLHMQNKDILPV